MSNLINVKIKKIKDGILPSYTHVKDSCMDCHARCGDFLLKKGKRCQVPLGFALELPDEYEVQIRPRSGLTKKGIDVGWGTGECDYRGEYQATVINNSESDFVIHHGDRICQMCIKPKYTINLEEAEELSDTDRGTAGFGSSGL